MEHILITNLNIHWELNRYPVIRPIFWIVPFFCLSDLGILEELSLETLFLSPCSRPHVVWIICLYSVFVVRTAVPRTYLCRSLLRKRKRDLGFFLERPFISQCLVHWNTLYFIYVYVYVFMCLFVFIESLWWTLSYIYLLT